MPLVSKWKKTNIIQNNKDIVPFIPVTRRWNETNLHSLLSEHRMIYIKPDCGTHGRGVVKVEWDPSSLLLPYRYQLETTIRSFRSLDEMYLSLAKIVGKRKYLMQKGIDLLSLRGRPFDIRVMAQRTPSRSWKSTGIIGRLAHPRRIVTNYHNGGRLMEVDTLLKPYLSDHERKDYIEQLKDLGRQISVQCYSACPSLKEIGVDLGIDAALKPWILEINTRPDPYIFKTLDDLSIYKKVIRYHRFHRRSRR